MIDFDKVKKESAGRWVSIYSSLGISVGDGSHTACPVCSNGKQDSDRFRLTNETGMGEWFCNQCKPKKAGNGIGLVMKVLGVEYKEAMEAIAGVVGSCETNSIPKEPNVTSETFKKLFKKIKPVVSGDPVHKYLQNRGLKSMPKSLWYGKIYESETRQDQHAMVGIFRAHDETAITIHRTYITEDGKKLDIESPKKIMTPLKKMTGGAVRLYEYEKGILGITEGIETAIAVHESVNIPVWAALSSTLMESFVPPKEVESVVVFGDSDFNFCGERAAYVLANKIAINNKIPISVEIPTQMGTDFLDEITLDKLLKE